MVALRCPCSEGEQRWVLFDDERTREAYTEYITHCPGCGRPLERKDLRPTNPVVS
jgi:hypothetical protein